MHSASEMVASADSSLPSVLRRSWIRVADGGPDAGLKAVMLRARPLRGLRQRLEGRGEIPLARAFLGNDEVLRNDFFAVGTSRGQLEGVT